MWDVRPSKAWILPLLSAAAWWAMVAALMICWFVQGRPLYTVRHYNMNRFIIYLSEVAATNLQPVFICGSAVMGIFLVWAVYEEFRLRGPKVHYLLPRFNRRLAHLHIAMIILAALGCISILLVSCLKVTAFGTIHTSFLGCFVLFMCGFMVCNLWAYWLYYKHYNKRFFLKQFILKLLWAIAAVTLLCCFGAFQQEGKRKGQGSYDYGYSAICEWSTCYIYSFLPIMIAFDLWGPKDTDTTESTSEMAENTPV